MGGIRVYSGMPNHKVFKATELDGRLQNLDRWIVPLTLGEAQGTQGLAVAG